MENVLIQREVVCDVVISAAIGKYDRLVRALTAEGEVDGYVTTAGCDGLCPGHHAGVVVTLEVLPHTVLVVGVRPPDCPFCGHGPAATDDAGTWLCHRCGERV